MEDSTKLRNKGKDFATLQHPFEFWIEHWLENHQIRLNSKTTIAPCWLQHALQTHKMKFFI